jgi:hypothetical protein
MIFTQARLIKPGLVFKELKLNWKNIFLVLFVISILLMPLRLTANTPKLGGSFLKVEGLQVQFYNIKVQYKDKSRSDYQFKTSLENGKIYIHPLPGDVEATINVIPITNDFISQKPFSIGNQELLNLWYTNPGKDHFATHNFEFISKNGLPLSELASSADLIQKDERFEEDSSREFPCGKEVEFILEKRKNKKTSIHENDF